MPLKIFNSRVFYWKFIHLRNGMETTMPHKEKASEMKHYAGKAVFSAAIGHALDGLDLMI